MSETSTHCPPETFKRLCDGLRPTRVAKILGVSRQSVFNYQRRGASEDRVRPLREFLRQRGEEAQSAAA